MRINPKYFTPVLAAGAAALALTVAPIAAAAPSPAQQSCVDSGSGTECQSPGNVQIYSSPPVVNYDPYGYDGFLLGGFGNGGGFHGGGFGGHGGGGGHR
jgi:hypothetical protein